MSSIESPPHNVNVHSISIPDDSTPLLRSDIETDAVRTTASRSASIVTLQGVLRGADEQILSASHSADGKPDTKTDAGILGIISVLLLGCFIANADSSIIMATYGTIASEIDRLDNASWLIVTYGLAACAIQPTYGKLSDLYGRKGTLIFSYTFFTIGCALCGAARNLWQMVLGRVLGGLGSAGMTSLVSVLIADTVPLRDIATWRSYVNIASTVGRSAGGPIGGYLADTIGWRWSFYIQCPLAVVAILLVSWKIRGSKFEAADTRKGMAKLRRVDFLGSLSLAAAIVGFLVFLDLGGQKLPWKHPVLWIILGAAAVFSVLFLLVEAFIAIEPIFPLRLLVHRDVVTAYLIAALQGGAQFAVMYTVPLYFQVTAHLSATNAGARLIPAVAGNAIAGILCGIIIKRTASYKLLTLAGTLSSTLGYTLLIVFWKGNTSVWESFYIGPGGFGTGLVFGTTFVAIAAGVDESQMAIASTGLYLSGAMGGVIGASLASNILLSTLRPELERGLDGITDRDVVIERIMADLEYVKSLKGEIGQIVKKCYAESFEYTHAMSLICAILATLVTLFMKEHDLSTTVK